MKKQNVAVLGGGVAGLSAALSLAQAGCKVTVLEKLDQVGGLCRTINFNGYMYDIGGHRFITSDATVFNLVAELVGEALKWRERNSVIWFENRYFNYPIDLVDIMNKLSLGSFIKSTTSYAKAALLYRMPKDRELDLESWMIKHYGKKLYRMFFEPYTMKLWGVAPSQLSADWAQQRISGLSLFSAVRQLLWKRKNNARTFAPGFHYPTLGIGMIPNALAKAIRLHGGSVMTSSMVKEIQLSKSDGGVLIYQRKGNSVKLRFDYLINTIPIPAMMSLLSPVPFREVIELAESLQFRALRLLFINLKRRIGTSHTWMYFPQNDIVFFRLQQPHNWSEKLVPEGKGSFIAEIACNRRDDVYHKKDDELLKHCLSDMRKVGLNLKDHVQDAMSITEDYAYPIYTLGYREILEEIWEYLFEYPRLICCGRQGLFRYNNLDHSIQMGQKAADIILKGTPRKEIMTIADGTEKFETNST